MSAHANVLPVVPDWFRKYLERGFSLISYEQRSKGPSGAEAKGWPSKSVKRPDDYIDGRNWGVLLGCEIESGRWLADIDFDWSGGKPFAKRILPATGFGFGRPSKDVSHAFYTTSTPLKTRVRKDVDGTMLVELRGSKSDGAIGYQTMLPPSVHPSGEFVEMRLDGDIAHTDADDIERRFNLFAITCTLKKNLGHRGFGHDVRLAVCGFLLRKCRLTEEEVITVGEALAIGTGNDVDDVREAVRYTAARIKNGDRVTGAGAVAAAIGDDGKKVVALIREWLDEDLARDGDAIVMEGGKLTAIVNRVEAALVAGGSRIYQRGGVLVRPVKHDQVVGEPHTETVRRAIGATVLAQVREPWLLEQMGQQLKWYRGKAQADPHAVYARTLIARGEWAFQVLRGIVTAPTLAYDGRIVETPGFDQASGLLLEFPVGMFPPVPAAPTRADAEAALALLAHPLRGLPYVDDASRSVALSAMLTALVRGSLRTAPLHGFDAPVAGTGKSMLAEMVGLLSMGVRPPALSQGKTAEEDEKRLSTVLFAGDSVIHIDNCERAIAGDFLCSLLTQEIVQARILGLSERRVLPSTALILASGNNLTLAGDASRRAVVCRLDAKTERPDIRTFDFDPRDELLANRPVLVAAGLTILRAYLAAGKPEKLKPMGSFTDWEWVRGALVWLGCADPADTRQAILDSDPRRDELLDVMRLWADAFGSVAVEVADIKKQVDAELQNVVPLHDKLIEVACHGGWNGKSVGWWLKRHKDRVVAGGQCFRCENGRNGQRWMLAAADSCPWRGSRCGFLGFCGFLTNQTWFHRLLPLTPGYGGWVA